MLVMLLVPVELAATAEQLADQLSPEYQGASFTVPVGPLESSSITYRGSLPVITDGARLAAVRNAASQLPGVLIREVENSIDGESAWPAWLAELGLQVNWPPRE